MPTYEYGCRGCQHAFEIMQPISSHPLLGCGECKRPLLRRKISGGGGVIFKGSGFYETDYKRKPKPPAGEGK